MLVSFWRKVAAKYLIDKRQYFLYIYKITSRCCLILINIQMLWPKRLILTKVMLVISSNRSGWWYMCVFINREKWDKVIVNMKCLSGDQGFFLILQLWNPQFSRIFLFALMKKKCLILQYHLKRRDNLKLLYVKIIICRNWCFEALSLFNK